MLWVITKKICHSCDQTSHSISNYEYNFFLLKIKKELIYMILYIQNLWCVKTYLKIKRLILSNIKEDGWTPARWKWEVSNLNTKIDLKAKKNIYIERHLKSYCHISH